MKAFAGKVHAEPQLLLTRAIVSRIDIGHIGARHSGSADIA